MSFFRDSDDWLYRLDAIVYVSTISQGLFRIKFVDGEVRHLQEKDREPLIAALCNEAGR